MYKKAVILTITLLVASVWAEDNINATAQKRYIKATSSAVEQWQENRFGMFIHWGPVSIKGTEIGWSRVAQVSQEEYDSLYKQFNPEKFNADKWVRIAKNAGMRYIVLTTKHHDGFCLWHSKHTDYHIGNTPFKRDVVKELSDACKKQGIAFGVYYSICDWYHPDYPQGSPHGRTKKKNPNMERYEQYIHNQLTELSEKYGPLVTFWFDGEWESPWTTDHGIRLYEFCKQLDPAIIINNRVGKDRHGMGGTTKQTSRNPGDYDTPEQTIGGFNNLRPWETCMTICRQWAWKPDDQMKSFKKCIRTLIQTVGGDGNFLFNVGPMSDGRIEPRQVERLQEMGAWLKRYGESIYGTRGGPFYPDRWGVSTHKGNTVYVHVFDWHGDDLLLPGLNQKIIKAEALTGGNVKYQQNTSTIKLTLSKSDQDSVDTIIQLKMNGPITEMAKLKHSPTAFDLGKYGKWLSKDATYEMSSRSSKWSTHDEYLLNGKEYNNDFAIHTDKEKNPYIIIDLGHEAIVKGLEIMNRLGGFQVQERTHSLAAWVSTDKASWQQIWEAEGAQPEWAVEVTQFIAGINQPGVKARFIKLGLQQDEPEFLHLRSVKVYGE